MMLCFTDNGEVPKDTKAAFLYLRELFPCDKFEFRIPPIILKHQLYSIVKNRTQVDKELVSLENCQLFTSHHYLHVMTLNPMMLELYIYGFKQVSDQRKCHWNP